MSTNLHNLAQGRLSTLVGSAFVSDGDDVYAWLPGLVCLLALGELVWRSKGLLITFTIGHIGATLIVAGWLAAAVEAGWLPTSIARARDVGISYGAVCVLGALTASIPSRWRPAWIGWWLGIAVAAASGRTSIHRRRSRVALLLGMGLSFRLRSTARLDTHTRGLARHRYGLRFFRAVRVIGVGTGRGAGRSGDRAPRRPAIAVTQPARADKSRHGVVAVDNCLNTSSRLRGLPGGHRTKLPCRRSSPIKDFKNTDLPVPEGPISPLTSPAGMSLVTSSQTRVGPNDLLKPRDRIPMPICRFPKLSRSHPSRWPYKCDNRSVAMQTAVSRELAGCPFAAFRRGGPLPGRAARAKSGRVWSRRG